MSRSSQRDAGNIGAKKHPIMHLAAGGIAGVVESALCHPFDTIKTRVQLAEAGSAAAAGRRGAMATTTMIVKDEGFFALYKGLSAVMTGVVPKMAVRFWSFQMYQEWLGASDGDAPGSVFLAGLGSGVTEAVLVVTPTEMCKVRMQAEIAPAATVFTATLSGRGAPATTAAAVSKYENVLQTAALVAREEGLGALYKGLVPTVLRQGCNQAINFSCYQMLKKKLSAYMGQDELHPWHHMILGGMSGGIGPCINNPLDVVKTRIQQQVTSAGETPKYGGFMSGMALIARQEGMMALWSGLAPRLLRIMPGQAITFMTYEWVSQRLPDTLPSPTTTSPSSRR